MLAVLAFNAAFGTNDMYRMRKPSQPSLLDCFGPWPLFILTAEGVAALPFSLIGFSYGLFPQSLRKRAAEDHEKQRPRLPGAAISIVCSGSIVSLFWIVQRLDLVGRRRVSSIDSPKRVNARMQSALCLAHHVVIFL